MSARPGGIRRALTALLMLGAILGASAALSPAHAQAAADAPYVVAYGDRIAVKVLLNGQGPFDFLLDTAATRTVIYEHARARLGIAENRGAPVTIFGITGSLEAPSLRLDELRLAGAHIVGPTIAVLPDTASRQDEPDGVLGLDVLRRYFIVLDHGDGRLRLYARAADAPQAYLGWPSVTLRPRKLRRLPYELWYIDAHFNDRPSTTLFDLGAGVTILNWPLGLRLGIRQEDFPYMQLAPEIQDVLGKSAPVVTALNLRVDIGARQWTRTSALVADAPVFALLDLADRPAALVGPGLLEGESLAVDFEGRRLYIAPTLKRRPSAVAEE